MDRPIASDDNTAAFLKLIRFSEGTDKAPDPYRVCFAYRHELVGKDGVSGTFDDFSDHPAITGEWTGERLPDAMCKSAGLGPGCVSTAAGAYQLIKPTWRGIRDRLRLPDFSPASQDRAALYLVANCGALEDVMAGRIRTAITKCSREWASLPGNKAGQPQRHVDDLLAAFTNAGGVLA
jgi:lysozyme